METPEQTLTLPDGFRLIEPYTNWDSPIANWNRRCLAFTKHGVAVLAKLGFDLSGVEAVDVAYSSGHHTLAIRTGSGWKLKAQGQSYALGIVPEKFDAHQGAYVLERGVGPEWPVVLRAARSVAPRVGVSGPDTLTPAELWDYLQRGLAFDEVASWEGTASELEYLLKSRASELSADEKSRIPAANPTLGKLLNFLAASPEYAGLVQYDRTATSRLWRIARELREPSAIDGPRGGDFAPVETARPS